MVSGGGRGSEWGSEGGGVLNGGEGPLNAIYFSLFSYVGAERKRINNNTPLPLPLPPPLQARFISTPNTIHMKVGMGGARGGGGGARKRLKEGRDLLHCTTSHIWGDFLSKMEKIYNIHSCNPFCSPGRNVFSKEFLYWVVFFGRQNNSIC